MNNKARLFDVVERSIKGPTCSEADFDLKKVAMGINKVVKKYDINVTSDNLVNMDTELADRVWEAAIEFLIKHTSEENAIFEDFHFVTGVPTSLDQLVKLIDTIFNKPIKVKYAPKRPYDVSKFYGDPQKAKDILGVKTSINLEEGLKKLVYELIEYLDSSNPIINSKIGIKK